VQHCLVGSEMCIRDRMNPSFEDEQPVNPFDLWSGANFKLKIRKVEGYPNYDKSEFDSPAPLFDDDDKLEAVWKQEHSLKELVDPKHFKSYDELKTRLNNVLVLNAPAKVRGVALDEEEYKAPAPTFQASAPAVAPAAKSAVEDDDDDLAFFSKLAAED
jgi:hypothetical protein